MLLWLLAHASRFSPAESGRLETCLLEKGSRLAQEQGARALGDLRQGVEHALQFLGGGFPSHPANAALRESLRTGR